MFGLKYKVLFSYCVLVTEKVWKYVWKYFMFATWMVDKFDYSRRSIVSLKQNLKDYWSERNFTPQISALWHKLNENALFVQTKCHLKGLKLLIEFSLKPLTKDCRNKIKICHISFAKIILHNTVVQLLRCFEFCCNFYEYRKHRASFIRIGHFIVVY